jgi:hypothetical protein
MIRFFRFKGLKAKYIHTERESVYHPEALALPTVKKCPAHFQQGGMGLSDDLRSGRHMTSDLDETISSRLAEKSFSSSAVLYRNFRTER